jgi:hypothetical protein
MLDLTFHKMQEEFKRLGLSVVLKVLILQKVNFIDLKIKGFKILFKAQNNFQYIVHKVHLISIELQKKIIN